MRTQQQNQSRDESLHEGENIVLYEDSEGDIRVEVRVDGDTVWLTQEQMATLFGRERSVLTKHIRNAYSEGELDPKATRAKIAQLRTEGHRKVLRDVEHYNLDVVISVGYRVKSSRGTQFRIWAARILREYLIQGYTIQQNRFENNAKELEAALSLIRQTAAATNLTSDEGRGLINVITRYTQTFLLLQRYDQGLLNEPEGNPGGTFLTALEARVAIEELKADLLRRREATELFGREQGDGLAALLGNLNQSVDGTPAYPSVESKAAHLLYFVIKNHPFTDGNKRIGTFLFVDFLNRNNRLVRNGEFVLNDIGLAAIALLVAESAPKDRATMIRLVMHMLAGKHDV